MAEPRQSFEERINEIDEASMEYYNRLHSRFLSYKGVKSRLSLRCDSYRAGKKLLAKITIGGNSLKRKFVLEICPRLRHTKKYRQ